MKDNHVLRSLSQNICTQAVYYLNYYSRSCLHSFDFSLEWRLVVFRVVNSAQSVSPRMFTIPCVGPLVYSSAGRPRLLRSKNEFAYILEDKLTFKLRIYISNI